jgi:hypothetical protein
MTPVRLALAASAVVVVLGLAAAAWAAPRSADGGAGSGGARAYPVIPSQGGGSEPAPDDASAFGGDPVTGKGPTTEVPPPQTTFGDPPTAADPGHKETGSDEKLVPLSEERRPASGGALYLAGEASAGGFSFLASAGFEVASLLKVGTRLIMGGLMLGPSGG